MTDDKEDTDEESSSDGDSLTSTHSAQDVDVSGILSAQRVVEKAMQPAMAQSVVEAQNIVEKTMQPAMAQSVLESQRIMEKAMQPVMAQSVLESQRIVEKAMKPAMAQSVLESQRIVEKAMQPAMVQSVLESQRVVEKAMKPVMAQSVIELQTELNTAFDRLNSPSIVADVSSVSETAGRTPTSRTPTVEQSEYPKTDVDEIYPPESRIHDKLVWEEGDWYRRRTRELSFFLVNYIFWKAKQVGDLSDVSDEEIGAGAAAAALIITYAMTNSPFESMKMAGATTTTAYTASKAVRNISERKGPNEESGDGDE